MIKTDTYTLFPGETDSSFDDNFDFYNDSDNSKAEKHKKHKKDKKKGKKKKMKKHQKKLEKLLDGQILFRLIHKILSFEVI